MTNKCECIATTRGNVIGHIQLVHEEAKYEFNQCEYKATHKGNLAYHIQSVYERAKYQCI